MQAASDNVNSVKRSERRPAAGEAARAFTLIELLVVISIIGVLAALIIGGVGKAKEMQYKQVARGEINALATAMDNYKSKFGFYPPSNKNPSNKGVNPPYDPLMLPPLYYELSGVTITDNGVYYTTLDGATKIKIADYQAAYKLEGVVNCTQGTDMDSIQAQNFLPGLKANQINAFVTNGIVRTTALVTSVGGPDENYKPLGGTSSGLNPFRYNSLNPTNNPGSYDLWVDLSIKGRTNRISNWSHQPQIVN